MWRSLVCCQNLTFSVYRVLAAPKSVLLTAAEQRRWNSNVKMTKVLKKMIDRGSGRSRSGINEDDQKWKKGGKPVFMNPNEQDVQAINLNRHKSPTYSEGQKRRAHQVGRVLYNHIVHLVNSGELSPKLASFAVEIVRVKVIPNFSAVNVYWLSSGSEADDEIEKLLKENAGLLRHLLISGHVQGNIPIINFVRDDSQASYAEVEQLLKTADFGPDFVPTRLDTSIREKVLSGEMEKLGSEVSLQHRFDHLNQITSAPNLNPMADQQPASLEVEQLLDQFQPRNVADGVSAEDKSAPDLTETDRSSANLSEADKSPLTLPKPVDSFAGFRDNLYAVNHTELMKKVLTRKHKVHFQPAQQKQSTELDELMKDKPGALRQKLTKRLKVKKASASQSDYRLAGLQDFGLREEDVEEDSFDSDYDEEVEESELYTPDDPLGKQ